MSGIHHLKDKKNCSPILHRGIKVNVLVILSVYTVLLLLIVRAKHVQKNMHQAVTICDIESFLIAIVSD